MLPWISLVSLIVVGYLGWNLYRCFGVDRIVVWAAPTDQQVRTLASTYAATESSADRGRLVYVTPADCQGAPSGVGGDRCLSWPEDKDKVRMLFMTAG